MCNMQKNVWTYKIYYLNVIYLKNNNFDNKESRCN